MANGQAGPAERELGPLDPFAGIPDVRYHLPAADLVRPLLEPGSGGLRRWRRQSTNAPIVPVENAYITGKLDLRGADLDFLFRFENCRFEFPPDVREAKLLGLVFRRCWLPGLRARNLRSRNDVRLIRSVVQPMPGTNEGETAVQREDSRERGIVDAALNLTDAVIEGSVVLTRTVIDSVHGRAIQADRLKISGAFLAYRLRADGEVRVPGMWTGGNVNLSGAVLRNPKGFALDGNGLYVGGSLLCDVDNFGSKRQPFNARGVLHLPSARVNGDIVFRGADLRSPQRGPIAVNAWESSDPYVDPWPALVADRLRVDGNVELSDGLAAVGTLRMLNARIGGTLRLARARITVPRGPIEPYYDRALHLDGSEISGDFEATGLRVPSGQVRMADVSIGGNLLAARAHLQHAERDVLSARRMKVAGNLHLTNCSIEGTLRLQGTDVGGSVELFGTEVVQPMRRPQTSFSVDLRTVKAGRNISLTFSNDRSFRAEGGVNMDGASAARRIDLSGAVLGSGAGHDIALNASDLEADELVLNPSVPPQGRILLRHAHCRSLEDNDAFWETERGIDLEGFRYDALRHPIGLENDRAVDKRISQLREAMPGYRPGPYDQLAAMLRTSGNEEHADTVLFRKQQYRYEALAAGYGLFRAMGIRVWSRLQRWMVGYGYRPVRALGWLIGLLVAGSMYFWLGHDSCLEDTQTGANALLKIGARCVVNSQDSGMEWNPIWYTADLLVPIVDFGNKGRWYMHGWDKWVSDGFVAMGWILATTVAAGAGRMIRRDG
ncbi:oxidoreductase [Amycolatopsis rhizosphaerae]|uniref:oxidoreductase n=1 Tax=Amycolatopsis rhizosphaerae TaxID=2053003 RepID=UPI001FEBD5E0|nr:oxidoreductase [Amycolatopsis rhizosphaerae]